jgi:hypothetical protein
MSTKNWGPPFLAWEARDSAADLSPVLKRVERSKDICKRRESKVGCDKLLVPSVMSWRGAMRAYRGRGRERRGGGTRGDGGRKEAENSARSDLMCERLLAL